MMGLMNVWNVKDQLLLNNEDYWINKKVEENVERDGSINVVESISVPTCDVEKIKEIHENMAKNQ